MRHCGLLRGESTRGANLCDLVLFPLLREGPQRCNMMVLLISKGKTNTYGRMDYSAGIRHVDVKQCSLATMAVYLFHRFHCGTEPFPDFSAWSRWYDRALFPSNNPN